MAAAVNQHRTVGYAADVIISVVGKKDRFGGPFFIYAKAVGPLL